MTTTSSTSETTGPTVMMSTARLIIVATSTGTDTVRGDAKVDTNTARVYIGLVTAKGLSERTEQ